eukprot:8035884-Prorocentrum_lima.AAC.1
MCIRDRFVPRVQVVRSCRKGAWGPARAMGEGAGHAPKRCSNPFQRGLRGGCGKGRGHTSKR